MKSVLRQAQSLLRRRKFSTVIDLLESDNNPEIYRDNFSYYMTLGLACLYIGDTGSASSYFSKARRYRLTDPTLLTAQAVLYLRRGDTDRAIEFYLDVLEYDPKNKIALSAMNFVKTRGTFEEINRIVDSGEIERFYPPLGVNPDIVRRVTLSAVAGIALAAFIYNFSKITDAAKNSISFSNSARGDLSELVLSVDEVSNAQEKNLSGNVYRYILNDKQIKNSYDSALAYFQEYRENPAHVEINRILNSNASESIKHKAELLLSYLSEPTFDSLSDNYGYLKITEDAPLYLGCWVSWAGRITNAVVENGVYKCDLLVGYENMERVDGIVPVVFENVPQIEGERSVKILGKISVDKGKLLLQGKAVYQPLN